MKLLSLIILLSFVAISCGPQSSFDPPEIFQKAEELALNGESKKAVKLYTRVILIGDTMLKSLAYNNRGLEYHKMRKAQLAIGDFSKAIELNPDFLKAYLNRAGIYFEIGNYKEALKDCNEALRIDPDNPNIYINRSMIFEALGEKESAQQDKAKGLELRQLSQTQELDGPPRTE